MGLPNRQKNRLENYNYDTNGHYFITICTKDRKDILSKIVGTGVLDCPKIELLSHGKIAEKYLNQLDDFYVNVSVDKYVIMPDHIHFILSVKNGQSGTPVPTKMSVKPDRKNSAVAKFVSTFKRFCNKEFGSNIWQQRFYDHIIRDQNDYLKIIDYIEKNPAKWMESHKNE